MKNIILFIALLSSLISIGQMSEAREISLKIIEILDGSEAIKEYSQQRNLVISQLEDVRHWTESEQISQETYLQLKDAYSNYFNTITTVKEQLKTDLSSIYTQRNLKKSRFKKIFKNMTDLYAVQIQEANLIYTNEWNPAMEKAINESESKGGIIASIVAIFTIGETIFKAFKDLFNTGRLNKEAEEQLFLAAIKLANKQIDQKLALPNWNDMIPYYYPSSGTNKISINRATTRYQNHSSIQYPRISESEIESTISLATYKEDRPIFLRNTSKKIVVNSDENGTSLPIFSTADDLRPGDKFWVKLQGNVYASFFYFDHEEGVWQDPYGKGIIVGSDPSGKEQSYIYLPAKDQFFEIVGDSDWEDFLIIISTSELSQKQRLAIQRERTIRDELFQNLEHYLPGIEYPENILSSRQDALRIKPSEENEGGGNHIVPLYITISKSN